MSRRPRKASRHTGLAKHLFGMVAPDTVLRPFAEEYALPYPLLTAPQELRDGRTPFGRISELPTRFLFGRDGLLLHAGGNRRSLRRSGRIRLLRQARRLRRLWLLARPLRQSRLRRTRP